MSRTPDANGANDVHHTNEMNETNDTNGAGRSRSSKNGQRGTGWSMSPFAPETARSGLRLADASLGEGGESTGVREVVGHPGWVAKLYKEPLAQDEAETLTRLIDLPAKMSWDEMRLVDRHSAWPVARVTDRGGTVGVIMPRIPDAFYVRFAYGEGGRTEPKELLLDHLVLQDAKFTALGLDPPSAARRRSTAARFLTLGALMERYDVVYGDWSYRNALWSQQNGDVFLIDLDSCGIESRKWIRSHHWEDPLFPQGTPLTTYTDRYRMAVLTLRVLTGTRGDPRRALEGLAEQRADDSELVPLLRRAVTTGQPSERPSVFTLLSAIQVRPQGAPPPAAPGTTGTRTGSANVSGWRDVLPPVPKPVRPPEPAPVAGAADPDPGTTTGTGTGAAPPAPPKPAPGCAIAFFIVLGAVLVLVLLAVR
ncbi:hypothetical protein [Streptomyces sp. NPDC048057]|uniref:hypothetical protein n=1 Tax=Streptomyces sp. NPDC048057 TaxID=3155628 RepID=UPI0033C2E4DA